LKRNIFAVCDLEVDYALNFMDYLNQKKNIKSLKKDMIKQQLKQKILKPIKVMFLSE